MLTTHLRSTRDAGTTTDDTSQRNLVIARPLLPRHFSFPSCVPPFALPRPATTADLFDAVERLEQLSEERTLSAFHPLLSSILLPFLQLSVF